MAIEDHHSAPIVVANKNSCTSFCTLNNISKDAEFQGLSETGFIFFERGDLKRLEVNYWLKGDHQR
jgi:hypothetical protein